MSVEERPPPDPQKLLAAWQDWKQGDITPGRAMASLKTGGLDELLAANVASGDESTAAPLLAAWNGWERGQVLPVDALEQLEKADLPGFLERTAAAQEALG